MIQRTNIRIFDRLPLVVYCGFSADPNYICVNMELNSTVLGSDRRSVSRRQNW